MSHKSARIFLKRAHQFFEKHPDHEKPLMGDLLHWGSAIIGHTHYQDFGELLSSQLDHGVKEARKRGVETSVEEIVEGLFSPDPAGEISADIIFGRFQLL